MMKNAVREEDFDALRRDIEAIAKEYPDLMIIGSGGNINKLFRLAEEKEKHKQAAIFPVESLRKINDELKRYTPAERRKLFRLKPDRAEVIVPAAEIFLEVARCGQSKEIWVPMIGLADGIIDSLYAKRLKAKR